MCSITIAIDRPQRQDGDKQTDFPRVQVFGKTAENVCKFCEKGRLIGIEGRIQTGNYTDNNGNKVYTTDVIVESWEFVESGNKEETPAPAASDDGFMNIPDGIDELPFN